MTVTGSSSPSMASWETLSTTVLRSLFYTFPGGSSLSRDSFERHASALLCYLFLVSAVACFFTFSQPRGRRYIHTRDALLALFNVIVPTCSLWPARYVNFARVPRSRVVILPLEMIIEDTVDGIIEFRNPINDLAYLVGPGVVVKGYTICVSIGWKWWISYFEWCLLSESNLAHTFGLTHWLLRDVSTNPISLGLSLFPFPLASSTTLPLLCLDGAPPGTIPSLNAGCRVTLEFTAFSPTLRTLSTAQIISALPFVISKHSPRRPRSLVSVLKQLNDAYGPNLVIDSLSNVSADYERALLDVYESFSKEPSFRDMWVKNLGIKAWHLDVFLLALEAALVRMGWIERWAVQVTVSDK